MSDPAAALCHLLDIMSALRHPQHGCPWDLQQNYRSIAPHTLEEVYEVIDAIEQGAVSDLESELGDLLFQVVFLSQLGRERGDFDFASVTQGIARKLLQRHPHVFPDGTLESAGRKPELDAAGVAVSWEKIKQVERQQKQQGPASALDDVPSALPALLRAAKLQKRAAHQGFDWKQRGGVLEKLREELGELERALESGEAEAIEDEFGDLLFTAVNLSRHLALEPERALRAANRKFETRFRAMERLVAADGCSMQELDEAALDVYWNRAKSGKS